MLVGNNISVVTMYAQFQYTFAYHSNQELMSTTNSNLNVPIIAHSDRVESTKQRQWKSEQHAKQQGKKKNNKRGNAEWG